MKPTDVNAMNTFHGSGAIYGRVLCWRVIQRSMFAVVVAQRWELWQAEQAGFISAERQRMARIGDGIVHPVVEFS